LVCFEGEAQLALAENGTVLALLGDMILIILIVLLVLALGGGGLGHSRWGYAGWSPAGILILILVILFLTGNLHL
jgi:hypothetical protein